MTMAKSVRRHDGEPESGSEGWGGSVLTRVIEVRMTLPFEIVQELRYRLDPAHHQLVASPRGGPLGLATRTGLWQIRCMDRDQLIARLKPFDHAVREIGATSLYLFGSRARRSERPDSDLDLFIDYDRDSKVPNLFRLMQIEESISKVLGMHVTITTRYALHPLMREEIERDAVRVL